MVCFAFQDRCKTVLKWQVRTWRRRTFTGNLDKQVQDPNLIASFSGHSENSRAFARYRTIDADMKKNLINLLD